MAIKVDGTGYIGSANNIYTDGSGNVGIGTSSVVSGNAISIYGGNVFVAGNIRISNTAAQFGGIVFPDGSFQNTAVTGVTLANDTATNAPRYINFSNTTTGTASVLYASNPGLVYYPVNGNLVIGGNLTVSNAVGISTFAGNVGIGTTTSVPGYILSVSGGLAATTKSFVINHPVKTGMKLQYASLEGPEHGVYIRGRLTNTNTIVLPEYWSALVDTATITVSLTPIGKFQKLFVEIIGESEISIAADGWFKSNIDCYYTVYAERRDVEKLRVEV